MRTSVNILKKITQLYTSNGRIVWHMNLSQQSFKGDYNFFQWLKTEDYLSHCFFIPQSVFGYLQENFFSLRFRMLVPCRGWFITTDQIK